MKGSPFSIFFENLFFINYIYLILKTLMEEFIQRPHLIFRQILPCSCRKIYQPNNEN